MAHFLKYLLFSNSANSILHTSFYVILRSVLRRLYFRFNGRSEYRLQSTDSQSRQQNLLQKKFHRIGSLVINWGLFQRSKMTTTCWFIKIWKLIFLWKHECTKRHLQSSPFSGIFLVRNSNHWPWDQCDQIGRFFALWATIQSWRQQLFYPHHPHCSAIFAKIPKSFIF